MSNWLATAENIPSVWPLNAWVEGFPWKICLHTTEGYSIESAVSAYRANASDPHLTIDPFTRRVAKHVPFNLAARSLYSGGTLINRCKVIQIEIVGFAMYAHDLPNDTLDFISEVIAEIMQDIGMKQLSYPLETYGAFDGIVLASADSPIRLPLTVYYNFAGLIYHQRIPYNDHWDAGKIDYRYIGQKVAILMGQQPAPPPELDEEEEEMHYQPDRMWDTAKKQFLNIYAFSEIGGLGEFRHCYVNVSNPFRDSARVTFRRKSTDGAAEHCYIPDVVIPPHGTVGVDMFDSRVSRGVDVPSLSTVEFSGVPDVNVDVRLVR